MNNAEMDASKRAKSKRKSTNLNLVIPDDLKLKLTEEARRESRTIRAQVIHLLNKHYEKLAESRGGAL